MDLQYFITFKILCNYASNFSLVSHNTMQLLCIWSKTSESLKANEEGNSVLPITRILLNALTQYVFADNSS